MKRFLRILRESEIHAVQKAWEKWILIVRGKYGEMQTFKNYGFLNISCETKIQTIFKKCEKWIPIYEKIMGKHKYS